MRTRPFFCLTAPLAIAYACVPADTRPPPGTLTMTVSPSGALDGGVTSADGWTITFDRVLVALGNTGFSDSCTVYGEADYDRIIDLGAGNGQKLGILHGLGQCDLRFRVAAPDDQTVLGANVTEDDRQAMRIPLTDPYELQTGSQTGAGASFDIAATATRAGVTKHFHFVYRRRVRYQRCTPDAPPADASIAALAQAAAFSDSGAAVDLHENEEVTYDLRIEPEGLFRDDVNPTSAALRFDPFAAADTNGDGTITLDEIRAVPITTIRDAGAIEASTYEVDDAGLLRRGQPVVIETLGDFVYELLAPTLVRFRDVGWCVGSASGRRGPG